MKRVLAVTLAMVFVLSALSSGSALAQPKGAVQLGAGMATVSGSMIMEISWDVVTLHAAGMFFPSPAVALIVDFSFGLPHDYKMDTGSDPMKFTMESTYLDIMAGACKHFADGGFLYASAGLAIGWSGLEISDSEAEYEIDTGIGFVVGAGAQIPIKDTFSGFAGIRQRYISTEFGSDETSLDLNAGGFEMVAGIAFTFGDQ